MIAAQQKGKIRLIMNMSGPKGHSFNDFVDELSLEKVSMSSAKQFGFSVIDCGRHARMWKWDWDAAYKNCPTHPDDFRLQGFKWLGQFFIETQQVFGSKAAVSTFDRLGHTVADLAAVSAHFPPAWMHRTLDDLPIVTPSSSDLGQKFAEAYTQICSAIGASLAPECPAQDKAFSDATRGTVLGVRFDTITLEWSVPPSKRDKILSRIHLMSAGPVSLNTVQKVLGSLNDFCLMCPFLQGFKHPLLMFLKSFNEDDDIELLTPPQVHEDLLVWAAAVQCAGTGLPIPHRPFLMPEPDFTFVSDAAGAQFHKQGDVFIPIQPDGFRGAASINCADDEELWFCARVIWPQHFLLEARDSSNHAYGCKSTTLEAVGIILPFLCVPEMLRGKEVLLLTDNMALAYGWSSRRINEDVSASILIRASHIISAFLGCRVRVMHLPRMSTHSARLADQLTRESSSGRHILSAIAHAMVPDIPDELTEWLHSPNEDWDLPLRLLQSVRAHF
jgi:hypothetical protein